MRAAASPSVSRVHATRPARRPHAVCHASASGEQHLTRRGAVVAPLLLSLATAARAEETQYSKASGELLFADTVVGDGATPAAGDVIMVAYAGTLSDTGAKFDASAAFTFGVGNGEVIKGWDVGILGDGQAMGPMRVGSTRKLRIPPALAYGSRGAGCRGPSNCIIPPNSTLDFTVTLKAIKTGRKQ